VVYVLIGVLALVLVGWLLHLFVNADPTRLAQTIFPFGLVLGATISALALGIGLLARSPLFVMLGVGGGGASWYGLQRYRQREPATGPRVSTVETDYLSMRLDHDSGVMSGTVRRGRFQGRQLSELAEDELIELWRSCRVEDADAANLLEVYLDRLKPEWRAAAEGTQAPPRGGNDAMTREEAYAILGLKPGASDAEVREAHHRLMMGVHPDRGGSTYLAAKLNQAREVLLGA
jgi:hypothetical protein